jgi:RNA polymerase sigma-70 factor (ECF subfamily)
MTGGRTARSSGRSAWGDSQTEHDTSLGGRLAAGDPSPPAATDDAAVARAVLDGDRDAFRLLVERELPRALRTATRVLADAHEAEDVVQEAFVIAYRSLATWRADGPFGAWLSRIVVRLAVRRAVRRRALPWTQPSVVADAGDPLHALHAPGGGPEGVAIRGEEALAVRRAVAALDEPYREVVALRFFAERSLDEIAVITGRPLGTVKTHLRRGLLRLRERVERGAAR